MTEKQLLSLKQRYDIVGNAEGLNRALDIALKIAPVDLSVLVLGENGAGKEVFPRIIHDHSLRKNKKYFAVNCGAIPEGTIDSELFGHEKGAFTGAVEKREGYFSVANGGTLFLDEVGELPLPTQARLLRVLETGEYIPVGSSEVRRTDVRIVAATNLNMERAIDEGKFREDLYYRLNSITITVPPLRERGDDCVLLFRKFALEMSEKYHMPPIRLDAAAQAALKAYRWPGNVRQLKNLAESMSVTSEAREITADELRRYLPEDKPHTQLAVVDREAAGRSFESEREILYKILFDLRRDVTELKRVVNENLTASGGARTDEGKALTVIPGTASTTTHPATRRDDATSATYAEAEEVKDTEEEQAPLSLEAQERELIRRTLRLKGGRRKETAKALGISERTLYRKINEYGIEP